MRRLLPFDFDDFTDTIRRYISEVEALSTAKRSEIVAKNRAIDDGVFAAAQDPRKKMVAPAKESVPPISELRSAGKRAGGAGAGDAGVRQGVRAGVGKWRVGAGAGEFARE